MTSGTTGRPNAVEHRHRNVGICAQYYERVLSCTRRDRLFATSRFHFAYAIGNMFAALRIGACIWRQSMHTKCTAPSHETAAAAASVSFRNATNSARESSPDAMANSACLIRPRPMMSRTRTL